MDQIKKLIGVGTSKGIIIPRTWLNFYRTKYGAPLKEVYITVTEMRITVTPVAPTRTEMAE